MDAKIEKLIIAIKLRFACFSYSIEQEVLIKKKHTIHINYKKAPFLLFVLVQDLMLMLITKLDGYEKLIKRLNESFNGSPLFGESLMTQFNGV